MDRGCSASTLMHSDGEIDRGKLIAFVEDPDNDFDIAKLLEDRNLMMWMETVLPNTMPSLIQS